MLLRSIEIFLREHDMLPSTFGREAANDPRFVFDLRNGRTPRPATERRVRDWMREYTAGAAS